MTEQQNGEVARVDRFLDSVLESADAAEQLAVDAARRADFPEDDLHKIGMAIRESMVNAVVHGNRYNARKKVHFRADAAPDRLTVTITDEGDGFDDAALPDPLSQPNLLQQSGRGIFLIRAFVDEFRVRRAEPQGTEVTLVKYKRAAGSIDEER